MISIVGITKANLTKAGGGNRTHNLRFTKPLLCQLSYTSVEGDETVELSRRLQSTLEFIFKCRGNELGFMFVA